MRSSYEGPYPDAHRPLGGDMVSATKSSIRKGSSLSQILLRAHWRTQECSTLDNNKCQKISESLFAFVMLPAKGYTTVVKLLEVLAPIDSNEQENDFSVLDNKEYKLT